MLRDALRRRSQDALRFDGQRGRPVAPHCRLLGLGAVRGDAVAELGAQPVGEGLDGGAAALQHASGRLADPRRLRARLQRDEPFLQARYAVESLSASRCALSRTLRGRPLEESRAAPSNSRGSSASISSGTSTIRASGRATILTVNTLQSYDDGSRQEQ